MSFSITSKIISREELSKQLSVWRLKDDKIVFTNGCFDLLHPGHILYLEEAARQGNRLVIGLNSDASVRRLKGESRPVNTGNDRALMLAALHFTDAVIFFDEDTPLELIRLVKPDVLVKGADYKEDDVVGADFVKNNAGQIMLIPFVEGYSSTATIEKIKKL
jgi:rfaE bifunctional protein nucleotidyltransferase chain/domain